MSLTTRSLELLRKEGWLPAVVERWIPRVNLRSDLWHFADLLACHPGERKILLVQVTSLGNLSSRLKKVRSRPEAKGWLDSGGLIECHGWCLRNSRWAVKRVALQAGDMAPVVVASPPKKRRQSRWAQPELW